MNWGKVFISSGVAFVMSITAAILIEVFGGAIGSVIGTIPSTIVPAIFLIISQLTQTEQARVESMMACVYGNFSTDILFMPAWRCVPQMLPKKWGKNLRVGVSTIITLLIWFSGTMAVFFLQMGLETLGLDALTFGFLLMVFTVVVGVCICWSLPPTPAGKKKVKWYTHIIRGLAAAIAIFISGVFSQTGAGVAAGVAVTFPSIMGTLMVSLSLSQGAEVLAGAIGPLLLGNMSLGWYAVIAASAFTFFKLNAAWCTLIAFVMSVCCWNIPLYFFIRWRRDTSAKKVLPVGVPGKENELVEVKEEKEEESHTPVICVAVSADSQ